MFSPVTKWADLILTPNSIPEMIRRAFKLAQTERPGSVYLGVPEDVESALVAGDLRPLEINQPRPDEPSPSQIARAAAVLNASQRPIILAGHGAHAGAGAAERRTSPNSWAFRWPPPFTARVSFPTTTPIPSVPSAS